MLTKALAVEFVRYGIRFNGVAPGFIETPQTEASHENPDRVAFVLSHAPMKRFRRADAITGPVVSLTSPSATFVNRGDAAGRWRLPHPRTTLKGC